MIAVLLGAVAPASATTFGFVQFLLDGAGGVEGLSFAVATEVSPDGQHVYAAGWGEDALAVLARSSASGQLTFLEVHRDGVSGVDGLAQASSVASSADGAHLYVSGNNDNALVAFGRDAGSGLLTFVEVERDGVGGVVGLSSPRSVAISPGGEHLYVACVSSNLVVFARNSTTGQLTYVETETQAVNGVDGLLQAIDVAVSPDGKSVYVVGESSDAVAVFARNPTTGQVSFLEVHKDGVAGVSGLDRPLGVTVSPDGRQVYATGGNDQAVVVFNRDPVTGSLQFLEWHSRPGTLVNSNSVKVSPDGHVLVASGPGLGGLALYRRSRAHGRLSFRGETVDLSLLSGVREVVFGPESQHLYTAVAALNALAAFKSPFLFAADFETGDLSEWDLVVP